MSCPDTAKSSRYNQRTLSSSIDPDVVLIPPNPLGIITTSNVRPTMLGPVVLIPPNPLGIIAIKSFTIKAAVVLIPPNPLGIISKSKQ